MWCCDDPLHTRSDIKCIKEYLSRQCSSVSLNFHHSLMFSADALQADTLFLDPLPSLIPTFYSFPFYRYKYCSRAISVHHIHTVCVSSSLPEDNLKKRKKHLLDI